MKEKILFYAGAIAASLLISAVVVTPFYVLVAIPGSNDLATKAPTILKREGFDDITVHGFSFWGCGRDPFSVKFEATKNGERLNGNICKGIYSGAIVRIN